MNYIYYPGCSLKSTGKPYEESVLKVFDVLGVPLEELQDWNCCGATSYMAIDEMKAFGLAARNLALAARQSSAEETEPVHLVTPCSACYLVLLKAQRYIEEYDAIRQTIFSALKSAQLDYKGGVTLRHPLDVFVHDIGLNKITEHVAKPLSGMRVACYYGCQMIRPYSTFDDHHSPTSMERLLNALGAETVDWPLKTRCCGGSLMGTIPDVGLRLGYILLKEAKQRGANAIVTACPLCQFNLECYQDTISKKFDYNAEIPVAYFTQLMGFALGLSEAELGFQRLFVSFSPLLNGKGGTQHVRL